MKRRATGTLLRWTRAGTRLVSSSPTHTAGTLRVLADVHSYLPSTRAGSERSLHAVLRWLLERGHHVTVLHPGADAVSEIDGLPVVTGGWHRQYQRSHVVLTQLDARRRAAIRAAITNRPLVHFIRMGPLRDDSLVSPDDLVVFNAEWLRSRSSGRYRATVLHPTITPGDYSTDPGDHITIVGLSEHKGARTFFELAARLPDRPFLAVRGSWGEQYVPALLHHNVEVVRDVEDIRDVYSRTRLLLTPSDWEPFGRVAIEAAASGIPVVSHPADGLIEALGSAGRYVNRADTAAWAEEVTRLDDPTLYAAASAAARDRSDWWASRNELADLESALEGLLTPVV